MIKLLTPNSVALVRERIKLLTLLLNEVQISILYSGLPFSIVSCFLNASYSANFRMTEKLVFLLQSHVK